jgi:hypothetical protein
MTKYNLYLGTITVSHKLSDNLSEVLAAVVGSWRSIQGWRVWRDVRQSVGLVGTINSLEVTYSVKNGWHVHKHILFVMDKKLNENQLDFFRQIIFVAYQKALKRYGFDISKKRGVKITEVHADNLSYVAKVIKEVVQKGYKEARINNLNPFDFLDNSVLSCERSRHLFLEYVRNFTGRKQLTYSKGLRELFGLGVERTDEELAIDDYREGWELLAFVDAEKWRLIVKRGLRGQVLEIAKSGDVDGLLAYLDGIT